jgi:hypothetical protein
MPPRSSAFMAVSNHLARPYSEWSKMLGDTVKGQDGVDFILVLCFDQRRNVVFSHGCVVMRRELALLM